jgi:nucleoside-diphosphate-sugar epimerase
MRVLVTGTEGYLGHLLAPVLMSRGHDVLGVDTGYYANGWLYNGVPTTARTLRKDIRQITHEDLEGIDAIVHMAELSNDPLGELLSQVTYTVNHLGSVRLAKLAIEAGVERFVYMSSCSVYGVAEGIVDETSAVDPQTAYADCKTLVERDVRGLASDFFSPISAQLDRVRRLARPAVRHRAERLAGLLDDQEDRHEQRRDAVAPARPWARHRQGDLLCARSPP